VVTGGAVPEEDVLGVGLLSTKQPVRSGAAAKATTDVHPRVQRQQEIASLVTSLRPFLLAAYP
jgi:hypothetical protein